jgi:hypothetical protein
MLCEPSTSELLRSSIRQVVSSLSWPERANARSTAGNAVAASAITTDIREGSVLAGLLKWIVRSDAPEPREPTERQRLAEARDRLRRQISILEVGPVYYRDRTPENDRLLTELRRALEELESEIAELSPEAGSGAPE